MAETYSPKEMIDVLRNYYEKQGYTLSVPYSNEFEPARVPIFASKKGKNSIFIDIITESNISNNFYFKDRTYSRSAVKPWRIRQGSSAIFFRHYFPNAEVYWAIPDYAKKFEDESFKLFVKNCEKNNIGLLEVTIKNGKTAKTSVDVIKESLPLMEERWKDINEMLEGLKKDQKGKIFKYVNYCMNENLSYLVFYPEPIYRATDITTRDEQYSISTDLINKLSELEHISYRHNLIKFSSEYFLGYKDDYTVAHEVTQALWNRYGLNYPKLHKDFEHVLKLDPKYRDHFLHAFQVFLHGSYIIDKLYPSISKKGFPDKIGSRIEDAWVIAATYHDYNYMIQNFETWTQKFFKEALHLVRDEIKTTSLDLSQPYVKDGYMFKTKKLIDCLKLTVDDVVLEFLYDRILIKKDHGLISGLSLLKYLKNYRNNCKLSERVIENACKAISIHNDDIWRSLSNLTAEDSKDIIGDKFRRKEYLKKLKFRDDPISFLLLLTDNIQEMGRIKDETTPEPQIIDFRVDFKDGKTSSALSFDGDKSTEVFNKKCSDFSYLKKFLDGDKVFQVTVTDRKSDQDSVYRI